MFSTTIKTRIGFSKTKNVSWFQYLTSWLLVSPFFTYLNYRWRSNCWCSWVANLFILPFNTEKGLQTICNNTSLGFLQYLDQFCAMPFAFSAQSVADLLHYWLRNRTFVALTLFSAASLKWLNRLHWFHL